MEEIDQLEAQKSEKLETTSIILHGKIIDDSIAVRALKHKFQDALSRQPLEAPPSTRRPRTKSEKFSRAVSAMQVNDVARTYATTGSFTDSAGKTRTLLNKDGDDDFATLVKTDKTRVEEDKKSSAKKAQRAMSPSAKKAQRAMSLVDYKRRGEGAIKALQAAGKWDASDADFLNHKPAHGKGGAFLKSQTGSDHAIDSGSWKFALLCRKYPRIAAAEGFSRRDYYMWGQKGTKKEHAGLRKVLEESDSAVKAFWSKLLL